MVANRREYNRQITHDAAQGPSNSKPNDPPPLKK